MAVDYRAALLGARQKYRVKEVDVSTWAEHLGIDKMYVRELSSTERDKFEASRQKITYHASGKVEQKLDVSNERANLLVRALCDENGVRIFEESQVSELGKLPGSLADHLYEAAIDVGGMNRRARELMEKNSTATDADLPTD